MTMKPLKHDVFKSVHTSLNMSRPSRALLSIGYSDRVAKPVILCRTNWGLKISEVYHDRVKFFESNIAVNCIPSNWVHDPTVANWSKAGITNPMAYPDYPHSLHQDGVDSCYIPPWSPLRHGGCKIFEDPYVPVPPDLRTLREKPHHHPYLSVVPLPFVFVPCQKVAQTSTVRGILKDHAIDYKGYDFSNIWFNPEVLSYAAGVHPRLTNEVFEKAGTKELPNRHKYQVAQMMEVPWIHMPLYYFLLNSMALSLRHEDFPLFTLVRNPYDRLVSVFCGQNWHHPERWGDRQMFYKIRAKNMPNNKEGFLKFCRKIKEVGPVDFDPHLEAQTLGLVENDKFVISSELTFRFEEIDQFFGFLKKNLGDWGDIPHDRKASNKAYSHYSEYYCDESKAICDEIYDEDFKYLGYDKTL